MDKDLRPPMPPPATPPADDVKPATAAPKRPLAYFQAARPASWSQDCCLYRVYVTGTDLLFIALGSGLAQAANFAAVGGAVGGLVGAAVAWQKHKQIERRAQVLDRADEASLRQLAEEKKDSFRAAVEDLRDVRIDPVSGWKRLFNNSPCVGVLRFTHAQKGAMSLELPAVDDVAVALAELPRLLGPALQMNLSWRSL